MSEGHTSTAARAQCASVLSQSEKMMTTSDTQKHALRQNRLQQTPAVYTSANEEELSFSIS